MCYEGERGDGSLFASALRFGKDGAPEPVDLPPIAQLPRKQMGCGAPQPAPTSGVAEVRRTWEDTPFLRALRNSPRALPARKLVAVQESLDMRRFSPSPIVAVHAASKTTGCRGGVSAGSAVLRIRRSAAGPLPPTGNRVGDT